MRSFATDCILFYLAMMVVDAASTITRGCVNFVWRFWFTSPFEHNPCHFSYRVYQYVATTTAALNAFTTRPVVFASIIADAVGLGLTITSTRYGGKMFVTGHGD